MCIYLFLRAEGFRGCKNRMGVSVKIDVHKIVLPPSPLWVSHKARLLCTINLHADINGLDFILNVAVGLF